MRTLIRNYITHTGHILILVFLLCSSLHAEIHNPVTDFPAAIICDDNPVGGLNVDSRGDAFGRAMDFIGEDNVRLEMVQDSIKSGIETVTFGNPTCPFLTDSLDERRCWLVDLGLVRFDLPTLPTEIEEEHPMYVRLWIDSANGHLVRLEARAESKERFLIPEIDVGWVAEQLKSFTRELYVGYVDSMPVVKLPKALDGPTIMPSIFAGSFVVFYVEYVTESIPSLRNDTIPAWVINLYDINRGNGYWRFVRNARTGEPIRELNFPYDPEKTVSPVE